MSQLETHNINGTPAEYEVYYVKPISDYDYWGAVTDILCPCCGKGTIRWNEAGFVPGYRTCDHCHNDFMAKGNAKTPKLVKIGVNSKHRN